MLRLPGCETRARAPRAGSWKVRASSSRSPVAQSTRSGVATNAKPERRSSSAIGERRRRRGPRCGAPWSPAVRLTRPPEVRRWMPIRRSGRRRARRRQRNVEEGASSPSVHAARSRSLIPHLGRAPAKPRLLQPRGHGLGAPPAERARGRAENERVARPGYTRRGPGADAARRRGHGVARGKPGEASSAACACSVCPTSASTLRRHEVGGHRLTRRTVASRKKSVRSTTGTRAMNR